MLQAELVQKIGQKNVSKNAELTKQRTQELLKAASRKDKTAIDELTGLKRISLNRVYKTGSISAKIAVSIAQVLGIDPYYLTGEADERGKCTDKGVREFLTDKGFGNLLEQAPKPARAVRAKKNAETPVAPVEPEFVSEPELVAGQEPIVDSSVELTEDEASLLLRSLYIQARHSAGAKIALGTVKRILAHGASPAAADCISAESKASAAVNASTGVVLRSDTTGRNGNKMDSVYYDRNDLTCLLNFGSQTDERGRTNSSKLGWDKSDLGCWEGVIWTPIKDRPDCMRLQALILPDKDMVGALILKACEMLQQVDVYHNKLTRMEATGCGILEEVECGENQITSLVLSSCKGLRQLNCYRNQLTSLDVSACTNLITLECYENRIKGDWSFVPNYYINRIDCHDNQISNINIGRATELVQLECQGNKLGSLHAGSCYNMEYLNCSSNVLRMVTFPQSLNQFDYVNIDINCLDLRDSKLRDVIQKLLAQGTKVIYENQRP